MSLFVLFYQQWFSSWTLPWLPSLYLIVQSWTLTLNEMWNLLFFNVVLGPSVTCWMSHRCTRGVILVGRSLLGSFTTVPRFLHLWLIGLTVRRHTVASQQEGPEFNSSIRPGPFCVESPVLFGYSSFLQTHLVSGQRLIGVSKLCECECEKNPNSQKEKSMDGWMVRWSQSLRYDFVTLPKLIDVSDFVFHVFL